MSSIFWGKSHMGKIKDAFLYITRSIFYTTLGLLLSSSAVTISIFACLYYQQSIIAICLVVNYFVLMFVSAFIGYKKTLSLYKKHKTRKGSNECVYCGKPTDDWIGKYDPCPKNTKTTFQR